MYINTGLYKRVVFKYIKPAESFLLILFTWFTLFSLTWIVTFFSLHFICVFLFTVRSWLVEQIILSASQKRQHASTACSTTFADRPFKKKYTSAVLLSHPNAGGYYIVTQTECSSGKEANSTSNAILCPQIKTA